LQSRAGVLAYWSHSPVRPEEITAKIIEAGARAKRRALASPFFKAIEEILGVVGFKPATH
jgi:hypothetical protein